jgi:DNA-directed RNA polymerase alpha subunit
MTAGTSLRTCAKGHRYKKSSSCPTCPVCEIEKKPASGFLSMLSAPARRALEHKNIKTLQQLANYTEKDILKLHGMGPSTIPKLRKFLEEVQLTFKD